MRGCDASRQQFDSGINLREPAGVTIVERCRTVGRFLEGLTILSTSHRPGNGRCDRRHVIPSGTERGHGASLPTCSCSCTNEYFSPHAPMKCNSVLRMYLQLPEAFALNYTYDAMLALPHLVSPLPATTGGLSSAAATECSVPLRSSHVL